MVVKYLRSLIYGVILPNTTRLDYLRLHPRRRRMLYVNRSTLRCNCLGTGRCHFGKFPLDCELTLSGKGFGNLNEVGWAYNSS